MKVLNFGSLNIDYVYSVNHIVEGGETILSSGMETFAGGKGMNQSIALAKAGIHVFHAGLIGEEGKLLLDECRKYGVDTTFIRQLPQKGGHTMIQVDQNGQNSIILYGGTNQMQTEEYIDEVLAHFEEGDFLILQNEINKLDYLIDRAYAQGMKIVLNPSPFDEKLSACDLNKIYLFLLNEIEGEQFTGCKNPDDILEKLNDKYPKAKIVLTLGGNGSVYYDGSKKTTQRAYRVEAVDTTAAGDTFTGYFISAMMQGKEMTEALDLAARASAIAVTRKGAAPSIPTVKEVDESNLF